MGLIWTLNKVERALVGEEPGFHDIELGKLGGSYDRTINQMRRTLLYVALGMDYGQYIRNVRVAEHVRRNDAQIDAREAETFVAYCVDTVVQIETRAGDLDMPFGRR